MDDSAPVKKFTPYKFKYESGIAGVVGAEDLTKWTYISKYQFPNSQYLIFIPNEINETKHTNIIRDDGSNKWTCGHRIGWSPNGELLFDVKFKREWVGTIWIEGQEIRTNKNYKLSFDKMSYPKLVHRTKSGTDTYKWYENGQLFSRKTYQSKTGRYRLEIWRYDGQLKSIRNYRLEILKYPNGITTTYRDYG